MQQINRLKKLFLIPLLSLCFFSCSKIGVFEKTIPLPAQAWFYNIQPSFTFNITDTTASYNVFIVLRHTDTYAYNNIWLAVGSQVPGDTLHTQNINMGLGNDTKGWEGTGMDDIYEVRKNITSGPVTFKKAGRYTFTLAQVMRENPLLHILNIGIRVEKVNL